MGKMLQIEVDKELYKQLKILKAKWDAKNWTDFLQMVVNKEGEQ